MPKILVVDDEATITTHLEERLAHMGYEIVGCASSGKEAVELARRYRPDLIIMDIVMPGELDGIEAASIIKEELNTPIVFLSAYGDEKFIKRAKQIEPFGYIVKPYQDDGLRAAVEVALYNKEVSLRLRGSEERWRLLAENLNEGIILGDSSGEIIFWNRGAENIFGYSADEAVGKPMTFIFSEAIRKDYKKIIGRIISTGESDILGERLESIGLRKDWSRFPLELSFASWKSGEQIFLICVVRDITARKREEEGIRASLKEKEILLDEVKQQVEKNLEVIYNLIDLQFEYLRDKDALVALKETRDRTSSITRMHEKLFASGAMARVDFATYIRNVTRRLYESYKADLDLIQLKIDVDNVFLDVKTAIPCGLVISELLSNALKYAFPAGREGKIRISFHREKEGRYSLAVSDNGVGFPKGVDFRNTESMGFQIIMDLVAQLGGEIKLDRKGGTKFKIAFEKKES